VSEYQLIVGTFLELLSVFDCRNFLRILLAQKRIVSYLKQLALLRHFSFSSFNLMPYVQFVTVGGSEGGAYVPSVRKSTYTNQGRVSTTQSGRFKPTNWF